MQQNQRKLIHAFLILWITPRSIVTDSVYGRLRRRIRLYTYYLRSVYDRFSPYYMIQYYGRISPRPYTEKYGGRIRSVYARKRPYFSVYGRKRASLENYGTLTMLLSRFMAISPQMEPIYRPVDRFHL
jgi:hypothetical protein